MGDAAGRAGAGPPKHDVRWVSPEETLVEINWECPCIPDSFKSGTVCHDAFKASYSCFLNAPQGKQYEWCSPLFKEMTDCVSVNKINMSDLIGVSPEDLRS
jgi:hypothetical protein